MDAQPRTSPIPPHAPPPEHSHAKGGGGVFGWVPTSPAWWGGLGFLRFHVSLFLTVVPVLFLVNLIQSSERLWIERVGLAWLALLVVHAAIAGIVWAIGFLQEDSDGSAARESTSRPRSTWITARPDEPEEADFRVAGSDAFGAGWTVPAVTPTVETPPSGTQSSADDVLSHPATPARTGVWDGWTSTRPASPSRLGARPASTPQPAPQSPAQVDTPEPSVPFHDPASDERVSWRRIAEAAWLAKPDDDTPDPTLDSHPADRRS